EEALRTKNPKALTFPCYTYTDTSPHSAALHVMDASPLKKLEQLEFSLDSVTDLSSSPSASPSSPAVATFSCVDGVTELRFLQSDSTHCFTFDLASAQLFKLGTVQFICVSDDNSEEERSFSKGVNIKFGSEKDSKEFCDSFEEWRKDALVHGSSTVSASKSKFDDKIEASSAKMYFHYYGQLLHQQNMLQDYVRTGTYYAAVMENRSDFAGRVVVDVGAGSGILSMFAAQAGAKHVYAVEASEMAEYARKLIAGNPLFADRITVIKGKVEDIELPEKADILISEPMGTLLVNERMLESYVIARDRFMSPNGKMFPTVGRIHMAPFSDEFLFIEMANKALFWQQQNYYGVDLTPLFGSAHQGYFSQPVVDAFDPRLLVAPPTFHTIDFTQMKEEDFYEIDIPLKFTSSVCTRVHGLACWFDVLFDGSTVQRWLTTAPGAPTTHWYQIRCVLAQPIYVMAGQEITGRLHLVAHSAQSYTIDLTLSAKMWGPGASQGGILQSSTGKFDLKEPYYRMSQPQAYPAAQEPPLPPQPQLNPQQDIQIQSDDFEEELLQEPAQNASTTQL
ncbi:unnamed protein product, partial [Brassica napus]